MTFAMVTPAEAAAGPYPYVYVAEDGTVHELDAADRAYLEEEFHPGDGARPYTKESYTSKDGRGRREGFCRRGCIPHTVPIVTEPIARER